MGRGERGLASRVSKHNWAVKYIRAITPYCAALKLNLQYWKDKWDMGSLKDFTYFAQSKELVVIEDSKLADIGSTNDVGVFYATQKKVDAVTFSPFAGNMQEATEQAHARGIGLISMCLMSNPQYEREKNKLVPLSKEERISFPNFLAPDIVTIEKGMGRGRKKQT